MGLLTFIKSFFSGDSRRKLPEYLRNLPEDELKNPQKTMMFNFKPPKEQYIVKNGSDCYVYASKNEMPEHIKNGVEKVESSGEATSSFRLIADGSRTDFSSIDDLPENVRRAIEPGR